MKLHFKEVGSGKTLIILHGLFGSGDNWATLARSFSDAGFHAVLVDQRNHGRSPHSPSFSYPLMADDLQELIEANGWVEPVLLGHSMGGKTVMFHAQRYAGAARGLIVADIAPRHYPPHHMEVIDALKAVDFTVISTRKQAEEILRAHIQDVTVVQFLLKNLYWADTGRLAWRFDLLSLERNIDGIGIALPEGPALTVPTLFLRGGLSDYIKTADEEDIRRRFKDVRIHTLAGAGHWLHADAPEPFLAEVLGFLHLLE